MNKAAAALTGNRARGTGTIAWLVVQLMLALAFAPSAAATLKTPPHRELLARLGMEAGPSDKRHGIYEYRLKSNGLTVLLVERHSAPVVTVMVLYKVGSRNEAVGYTGSTHFLEHMMFKGSTNFDPQKGRGLDDVLKPTGGYNNATTSFDRTNYYEVIPARDLEVCLALESDRMRNLLIRQKDRDAEMTVVRNELERGENEASRVLATQLYATAYREHPYHHPTIGWRSDVEGVPLARLKQFYNEFYWPNNATLLITGDFETAPTLEAVARYFGKIPRSPKPIPTVYTTEPPQQGERRFVVRRGQDEPKVMIAFHVPRAVSPDTYPLDVLDAVLGDEGRQASRFYRGLVEKKLASEASAYNASMKDPGLLSIAATPAPGVSPENVEKTILTELERLKTEPVDKEELARAKASIIKMMTILAADPNNLCEQLAETMAVADWQFWATYRERIEAVTADDVMRVARKYLTEDNRSVGYYLPRTGTEGDAKEKSAGAIVVPAALAGETAAVAGAATGKARAAQAPKPRYSFASQVAKKMLPNGMTVMAMQVPGIGAVSICAQINSGRYFGQPDKSMVPDLLAQMLNKGSKGFSKSRLAEDLDLMGSSLDFRSGTFFMQASTEVVTDDAEGAIVRLADCLRNPLLSADELDRLKPVNESTLKQRMSSTGDMANNTLMHNLYPVGTAYHQKLFADQLKELPTISRDDLAAFHARQVVPNNTTIAVVGDLSTERAFQLVEKSFGDWPAAKATPVKPPQVEEPARAKLMKVELKDKENVDIVIGKPLLLSIKDKGYFAELIANAALGHDSFTSRLAPVRNKHGLTYGISSSNRSVGFGGGPWVIDLSVNPANVDRANKLVHTLVDEYRKGGITAAELADEAKRQSGEYMVGLRTPSAIALILSQYWMLGLSPSFIDDYPKRLANVTKAEVDKAIRDHFNLDHAMTVMAGSFQGKAP